MSDKRPFRYRWIGLLMGPAGKKVGTYRTMGYWIADHIFEGQIDANPGLPRLAKCAGISERSAGYGVARLIADGWIGNVEGGGNGRTSAYWLLIPSKILQGLDERTKQEYAGYLARISAKHSKIWQEPSKIWQGTLQDLARESISEPTLQPTSESTESESEAPAMPISPSLASDLEDGRASLPAPDFKIRAMWTDRWPNGSEMLPRHPTENCWTMVGVHGARLLGYSGMTMPKENGTYLDRRISEQMAPAVMATLAEQMARGKLRAIDLATAIADMGYAPEQPKLAEREKAL